MGISNSDDNWGEPVEIQMNPTVGIDDLYWLVGKRDLEILKQEKLIQSLQLALKVAKAPVVNQVEIELQKEIEQHKLSIASLSNKNIALGNRLTELNKTIEKQVQEIANLKKPKAKKKKK